MNPNCGIFLTTLQGHGQTAARLQRDWGQPDPETLSFAPKIPTRALVSLLQKGLRYQEIESSLEQARLHERSCQVLISILIVH